MSITLNLIKIQQLLLMFMDDTLSKIQRRNTSLKSDFLQTYNKLNSFIERINDKIINRIQLVQQTYLQDYKAQVKQMTQQLKTIRGVLDQELLKQRSNQRLFFLQEQRDFFRGQTMKLNEEVTSLNKSVIKLKAQLQVSVSEAANYRQLVYTLQKKIVKVNNEATQMDKLNSFPNKMPAIVPQKQSISISPTKTSITRFAPLASHSQQRPLFKSVQLRKSVSKQGFSYEVKRREQILDECIKDIKKKIFYRTLGQRQSKKTYFNEAKEVPFQKFTRTDKQELIKSILSRDDLLGQFYNFMAGKEGEKGEAKKTFNNKSVFSDKILKIKLCGLDSFS